MGGQWDPLFARDRHGLMQKVMDEVVDGELQNCKAKGGAYTRENFWQYPEPKRWWQTLPMTIFIV